MFFERDITTSSTELCCCWRWAEVTRSASRWQQQYSPWGCFPWVWLHGDGRGHELRPSWVRDTHRHSPVVGWAERKGLDEPPESTLTHTGDRHLVGSALYHNDMWYKEHLLKKQFKKNSSDLHCIMYQWTLETSDMCQLCSVPKCSLQYGFTNVLWHW